ncbi:M12 family metallopeptidase [Sphingobacterium sp. lm-10]|uniref:M12 family metallopeptidase n=1 Tax=Sphingobacterium sp. lm-10 TaxID=2944904 RepID=UPI0020222E64|nr:M12 family metallopeptidase [Sphingobacterium sp. lm-10]MCL7987794.1 M12 family metallopeptidase [Sphingobacterium sp. lm-10]
MIKKQSIWKWSAAVTLSAMVTISCQKEASQVDLDAISEEISNVNAVNYDQYVGDPRAEACRIVGLDGETEPRGAALTAKLWRRGQVITVSFIGGTNFVRQKVIAYAKQWEQHANITFNFVANNGMLRVSFRQGQGSYSYLGTDALRIPTNQETMNFGWFNNNTSDTEFSRTTIHEFGHALGMIHEQQHPEAQLNWDREFVYDYYAGAPNYWSRQQVDVNLLNRYSASQTTYNTYDQLSIMHYPILGRMINQTQNTPNNSVLSNGDRQIAGILYPF